MSMLDPIVFSFASSLELCRLCHVAPGQVPASRITGQVRNRTWAIVRSCWLYYERESSRLGSQTRGTNSCESQSAPALAPKTKAVTFSSLLLLGFLCSAASGQVFKGHKIGETAQQFFSIATMAESNTLTTQYCKEYLANPKVLKAYDRAKTHSGDVRALSQSKDVNGCRDVQSALDGKDVRVDARYATELGSGWADFHNSRLVILRLTLKAGIPFENVVADIGKELGGAEPTKTLVTRQADVGGILQERRANWNANNLQVEADEMKDFENGDMGVAVVVADSEYLKEKTTREATRPSTIH